MPRVRGDVSPCRNGLVDFRCAQQPLLQIHHRRIVWRLALCDCTRCLHVVRRRGRGERPHALLATLHALLPLELLFIQIGTATLDRERLAETVLRFLCDVRKRALPGLAAVLSQELCPLPFDVALTPQRARHCFLALRVNVEIGLDDREELFVRHAHDVVDEAEAPVVNGLLAGTHICPELGIDLVPDVPRCGPIRVPHLAAIPQKLPCLTLVHSPQRPALAHEEVPRVSVVIPDEPIEDVMPHDLVRHSAISKPHIERQQGAGAL